MLILFLFSLFYTLFVLSTIYYLWSSTQRYCTTVAHAAERIVIMQHFGISLHSNDVMNKPTKFNNMAEQVNRAREEGFREGELDLIPVLILKKHME